MKTQRNRSLEGSKINENRGLEESLWALGVWWTIRLDSFEKLGSKTEQNGRSWGQVGLVPTNPSSTEHVRSPIHAPLFDARWRIITEGACVAQRCDAWEAGCLIMHISKSFLGCSDPRLSLPINHGRPSPLSFLGMQPATPTAAEIISRCSSGPTAGCMIV